MTVVLERTASVKPPECRRCLDISVADLESALKGLHYPAGRQGLIDRAAATQASEDVVAFLRLLPDGSYNHFRDIALMAWSFLLV